MPENLVACDVGGWVATAARIGENVKAGDPLLVIRTAEGDVVLDAPVAGRVARVFFDADDMLPEAAVVAIIET